MSDLLCKSCGAHLDEFDPAKIIRKGFCPYCVDQDGNIKPYDQILEGMISFIEEEMPEVAKEDLKDKADEILLGCAVWKKSKKVIFSSYQLRDFLNSTSSHVWGSGDLKNKKYEEDLSETWSFKSGDWQYNDNFYGSNPFAGREVVHYQSTPVWFSSYFGYVLKGFEDIDGVYSFLKEALRNSSSFYRGDAQFISGDWKYVNNPEGNIEYFTGDEEIFFREEKVYHCHYLGGLVG